MHVTIREANLAPLVRAVNHSESNDNEGFFDDIQITQNYCPYPIPDKYQLSVVLHQVLFIVLWHTARLRIMINKIAVDRRSFYWKWT